jgi:hypothetical protein
MALTPIVELGVAEAYQVLVDHFGVTGLPPLDAVENEDWGRDYILSRLLEYPASALAAAGLCAREPQSVAGGEASPELPAPGDCAHEHQEAGGDLSNRAPVRQRPALTLIEQREIEARIVGPLIRAFSAEIGTERTLAIVREVIRQLARESGADLARALGECTLEAFTRSLDRWRQNGALEIDLLEHSPERLEFNVTRCRYAEMYRALGLGDLGASLSCQRDFALAEGFNPEIQLTRTQTIMDGSPFCDFRFRVARPAETRSDEFQSGARPPESQSDNRGGHSPPAL